MSENNIHQISNADSMNKLECQDVIEHLGDLVDNELSLAQRISIKNHLDTCPDCATFFASYRHVVESAAELREPEKELEVGIRNRLRQALNQRLGINLSYIA